MGGRLIIAITHNYPSLQIVMISFEKINKKIIKSRNKSNYTFKGDGMGHCEDICHERAINAFLLIFKNEFN